MMNNSNLSNVGVTLSAPGGQIETEEMRNARVDAATASKRVLFVPGTAANGRYAAASHAPNVEFTRFTQYSFWTVS